QSGALYFRNEVRKRHWMAEFFYHDSRCVRQQNGLQADSPAHRISLYPLRRPSRPRLRRRSAAHRQALVQQRRGPEVHSEKRQRVTSMLELRPTCENCNKALPPDSLEARICTYECTFSALPALITSLRTSARTAAADSYPDRFGRRRTGKVTITLVRIPRVTRSSIGRLILRSTSGSLQRSKTWRLTNDRTPNPATTNTEPAQSITVL